MNQLLETELLILLYLILLFSWEEKMDAIVDRVKLWLIEFLKSYADYLVIGGFVVLILISSYLLWPLGDADIQLLIFLSAAFTLFFQAVIADRVHKYRNRPILFIEFDPNKSSFFHITTNLTPINTEIATYYARANIINKGKDTLENVEVILEKVQSSVPQNKPFLPLNLSWAGFINPPRDITRAVNIPRGQFRTIDFIEAMEPKSTKELANSYLGGSQANFNRYYEQSHGFRSCTICPTALSDIYAEGEYLITLGVYANNVDPLYATFSVSYSINNWNEDSIDKPLKVNLVNTTSKI